MIIEPQALFRPVGHDVQTETQTGKLFALATQRGGFVEADMAQPDQGLKVLDPERAQGHPAQRLQIAQTAGAVLDIRFEIIGGVAEALMARQQFLALGLEEIARRPHLRRRDRRGQRSARLGVGHQRARFDQGSEHGLVGRRSGALRRRAHRVTDRQAHIPEQRKQARQGLLVLLLRGGVAQHQHIHIRARKQFATSIAADRMQRQTAIGRNTAHPGIAHQLVDRACAQRDQALDRLTLIEAFAQAHVHMHQQRTGLRGPVRVAGDARVGSLRRRVRHTGAGELADSVNTSTPSSVTATMCSHCADSLRSLVTTVQPSGSVLW